MFLFDTPTFFTLAIALLYQSLIFKKKVSIPYLGGKEQFILGPLA